MDISPPRLKTLQIAGVLEFSRSVSKLSLHAINVVVRGGGRFSIGNATHPYVPSAEVVLHGDRITPGFRFNKIDYGSKTMAVFGHLEMYAVPRLPRWTQMTETANAGSTSIKVQGAVDWRAGDKIVIAPTGYDTADRNGFSF